MNFCNAFTTSLEEDFTIHNRIILLHEEVGLMLIAVLVWLIWLWMWIWLMWLTMIGMIVKHLRYIYFCSMYNMGHVTISALGVLGHNSTLVINSVISFVNCDILRAKIIFIVAPHSY